jgi:hypothetical protein
MEHSGLVGPPDDDHGWCFVRLDQFNGDRFGAGDLAAGSATWDIGDSLLSSGFSARPVFQHWSGT